MIRKPGEVTLTDCRCLTQDTVTCNSLSGIGEYVKAGYASRSWGGGLIILELKINFGLLDLLGSVWSISEGRQNNFIDGCAVNVVSYRPTFRFIAYFS